MKAIKIAALVALGTPALTFTTMFVLQLAGGTDDDFVRAFYYASGIVTGAVLAHINRA